MVSTLIAVAIGAIVAALVAQVITEAVGGQRAIIDRDEMSEFTLYVKSVLTNDPSCIRSLRGLTFPVTPGETEFEIGGGYQDLVAPIKKDFEFAAKKLIVSKLAISNKGLDPVAMNASVTDAAGTVTVQPVTRYMARIQLDLKHINGSGYRPRYFEIPVHVDAANRIVSCNNEFNISDACDALGFEYNPAAAPGEPLCQPSKACMSGGSYGCGYTNPATGGFSCPAGFTEYAAGAHNIGAVSCGKWCCRPTHCPTFHCLKCKTSP